MPKARIAGPTRSSPGSVPSAIATLARPRAVWNTLAGVVPRASSASWPASRPVSTPAEPAKATSCAVSIPLRSAVSVTCGVAPVVSRCRRPVTCPLNTPTERGARVTPPRFTARVVVRLAKSIPTTWPRGVLISTRMSSGGCGAAADAEAAADRVAAAGRGPLRPAAIASSSSRSSGSAIAENVPRRSSSDVSSPLPVTTVPSDCSRRLETVRWSPRSDDSMSSRSRRPSETSTMFSSEMRSIESMANAEAALAVGVPPTPGPVGGPVPIARGRGSVTWLPDTTMPAPATRFDSRARSPVVSSM